MISVDKREVFIGPFVVRVMKDFKNREGRRIRKGAEYSRTSNLDHSEFLLSSSSKKESFWITFEEILAYTNAKITYCTEGMLSVNGETLTFYRPTEDGKGLEKKTMLISGLDIITGIGWVNEKKLKIKKENFPFWSYNAFRRRVFIKMTEYFSVPKNQDLSSVSVLTDYAPYMLGNSDIPTVIGIISAGKELSHRVLCHGGKPS